MNFIMISVIVMGLLLISLLVFLAFPIHFSEKERQKINIARVLSVILPGLGHVYMGRWIRGIILFIIWIFSLINFVILNAFRYLIGHTESGNIWIGVLIVFIFWLCGLISLSGWRKAKRVIQSEGKTESL